METMFPQGQNEHSNVLFDKHTIETPEQLRLDFAVAGIGSRFLALAIDSLIQIAVVVLLFIILAAFGSIFALAIRGQSSVWLLAATSVLFFLLFFGYFAIFEILWNGQTPGKRMIGIRVVKDSGRPLTPAESIGRNLLRIVDQLPAFYAVGVLVALLNAQNKRLGDFVAGSMVVREASLLEIKPIWQTVQSASAPVPGAAPLLTAALSMEESALIDAFLHRRRDLAPDVRYRMAGQIAGRLRPKLTADAPVGLSDEALLEALAYERRSFGIYS